MNELHDITNKVTQDLISKLFREMEKDMREHAIPPIKGELTKGKIQWRGLVLCSSNSPDKMVRWIEQRGKIISRFYVIDFTLKINNGGIKV